MWATTGWFTAEPDDDDLDDIRGFDEEAPRGRDRFAYARVNDDDEEEEQ